MALTEIPIELSSTPSIVDGGNATAITIDSSERVLIGKTATGLGASGTEINPNGYIQVTEDQSPPLYLNRLSTDGSIVNFYKAGSVIGEIGTGSSLLTIGTGTGRVLFENALVAPCSDASAGASNGVIDLGASSRRFKDLYLSGGAFLGGTAAANKLDEYESGTWSLTSNATITNTIVAQYVRIGRLVTGVVDVQLASGQTSSAALAFNVPLTLDGKFGAGVVNYTNGSLVAEPLTVNPDPSNNLHIRYDHESNATIAQFNGARIIFNFTYFTNA